MLKADACVYGETCGAESFTPLDDCPSGRLSVMKKKFAPLDVCPSKKLLFMDGRSETTAKKLLSFRPKCRNTSVKKPVLYESLGGGMLHPCAPLEPPLLRRQEGRCA